MTKETYKIKPGDLIESDLSTYRVSEVQEEFPDEEPDRLTITAFAMSKFLRRTPVNVQREPLSTLIKTPQGELITRVVQSLAERLAATDGFVPTSMTLNVEPVKNGIAVVSEFAMAVPAWTRYVDAALEIVRDVTKSDGDDWLPMNLLDPAYTQHVAMIIDGHLYPSVHYEAGEWLVHSNGFGDIGRPITDFDGPATHWRFQPELPVDIQKAKM